MNKLHSKSSKDVMVTSKNKLMNKIMTAYIHSQVMDRDISQARFETELVNILIEYDK